MLYLAGTLFSLLVVIGNTLFKYAVDRAEFSPNLSYMLSAKMIQFLLSWQFILGTLVFGCVSILSFWMLTRFQFSSIQAVTVPVIMALSFAVGTWFFNDTITPINIVGFFVIIAGVILATIK
jgi:drug/metabolite transporter (DMT)-like permease